MFQSQKDLQQIEFTYPKISAKRPLSYRAVLSSFFLPPSINATYDVIVVLMIFDVYNVIEMVRGSFSINRYRPLK